jgi:HEPN domain-containing protein
MMSESVDASRVLLGLAVDDELAAKSLLPVEGITDAILGFHAQQAVEKATKAVLGHGGVEYPYSHDLDGLFELCQENNIKVPDTLSGASRLSVFGVRLRYGTTPETHLDRGQALKWAGAAVAWARAQLEAVQPPEPDKDEVSD